MAQAAIAVILAKLLSMFNPFVCRLPRWLTPIIPSVGSPFVAKMFHGVTRDWPAIRDRKSQTNLARTNTVSCVYSN
jgi:hypothetical protein